MFCTAGPYKLVQASFKKVLILTPRGSTLLSQGFGRMHDTIGVTGHCAFSQRYT